MKKVLKKTLVIFLIIITLFNYTIVQADAGETIENLLGTFIGIITWIFRLPPIGVAYVMNALTADLAFMDNPASGVDGASAKSGEIIKPQDTITPYEIFFNQVQLFDVNFFDFSIPESSSVYKIRAQVAKWFYVMRLVAISILLVVLIYVGIRMALTTIADDKARYKHMLVDWVTSLALVFVLQFIIIIVVNINNTLVNAIGAAGGGVDKVKQAIDDILGVSLGVSPTALGATVVYCMIVWQTFGFVLSYLNRTIKIAFLIIISPLISITYSIDKMGDGKSQAVNNWLKEFIYSILMQPFHAVIYMTMVDMALGLLADSGGLPECILAILCIKFVKTAEDLVRSIFAFNDDNKDTSLAAGTAAAAVALNKTKSIGTTARKGVNMFKESKITDSIKNKTTKVRAAARALRETSADKKARLETGAPKAGFATRMKQQEAKIEQERADKKEAKANKKAYKMFQKHKNNYTTDDKKNIFSTADKFQRENPGMQRGEALKMAATKVSREKIESGAYKNKVIKGVKRVSKAVSNSETAKFIKNTVIPVGFGAGVAFMAFGGDSNAFDAGMLGMAAGKSMGSFMTSSTATLAGGIAEQLRGKGIYSSEDSEKEVMRIKLDGDGGNLDEDAKKKQKEAMEATMGYSNAVDVKREVDQKFKDGEYEFDVSELVRDMLRASNMSEEQIKAAIAATQSYKNFQHDSLIYTSIGNGENAGISAESIASKVGEEMDIGFTENKFIESAKERVISKETVKVFKNKNDYELEDIKAKLTLEIKKVEEQIEKLKEQKLTMGSEKQIRAADKNIRKLESSKEMLEENVNKFADYESELNEGTF